MGRLVHLTLPAPFGAWSVRWFARRYKINLSEAELPIEEYPNIGSLFTRRLKPGLRPIEGEWVHPADSQLMQRGQIEEGKLFQIKGWSYSLQDFLGISKVDSWTEGYYFTYYLCPTDYHRVHSPVKGKVQSVRYIPGKLWPVNNWSVGHIRGLFVRNERLLIQIQSEKGLVVVAMVGATNVGKMTLSFDPEIVTNQFSKTSVVDKEYSIPHEVLAGDELGTFHMGSTVVVLYPPGGLGKPMVFSREPKSIPVQLGGSLFKALEEKGNLE